MGVALRLAVVAAVLAAAVPLVLNILTQVKFDVPEHGSAIVVTGGSSGIGRDAAIELAERGFVVFAGVRKESDRSSLRRLKIKTLKPIILDVTDSESIKQAFAEVEQWIKGNDGKLGAIINNAGVSASFPLELVPKDLIKQAFEVNVYGVVEMTQQFLPLLRESRGRVVNIGSISGFVSTRGRGVYSATKHAVEAITDTARRELQPFGVSVSIVDPGAVRTAIVEKVGVYQTMYADAVPPELQMLYPWYFLEYEKKRLQGFQVAPGTEVTSAAIVHAVTSPYPKARYIVSGTATMPGWLISWVTWLLPDRLEDLFVP